MYNIQTTACMYIVQLIIFEKKKQNKQLCKFNQNVHVQYASDFDRSILRMNQWSVTMLTYALVRFSLLYIQHSVIQSIGRLTDSKITDDNNTCTVEIKCKIQTEKMRLTCTFAFRDIDFERMNERTTNRLICCYNTCTDAAVCRCIQCNKISHTCLHIYNCYFCRCNANFVRMAFEFI